MSALLLVVGLMTVDVECRDLCLVLDYQYRAPLVSEPCHCRCFDPVSKKERRELRGSCIETEAP